MRAKFINEDSNFERGGGHYKSLGIGSKPHQVYNILKDEKIFQGWESNFNGNEYMEFTDSEDTGFMTVIDFEEPDIYCGGHTEDERYIVEIGGDVDWNNVNSIIKEVIFVTREALSQS
jgi:hypothetical protein